MDELELRLSAIREVQREQGLRERALAEQGRAESLARTLQRTLSPPRLPQIAGLEVAAHYEPFAPEEVGGDFYDLFPLTTERAGFFLGDVCGKGPEAAGVTSLARYTIRAAALLSDGPAAILANLNTALLARRSERREHAAVHGGIRGDRHEHAGCRHEPSASRGTPRR